MIKYPKDKIYNDCDITQGAYVGKKFNIGSKVLTCVHIENGKYIFSFDELPILVKHNELENTLKEVYNTGNINGINILPKDLLSQVDFFFVPTEYQIFGKNIYANESEEDITQFDYYKKGNFNKIKCFEGDPHWYWLSNESICKNNFCNVGSSGLAGNVNASCLGGVPIFFQITKKGDK